MERNKKGIVWDVERWQRETWTGESRQRDAVGPRNRPTTNCFPTCALYIPARGCAVGSAKKINCVVDPRENTRVIKRNIPLVPLRRHGKAPTPTLIRLSGGRGGGRWRWFDWQPNGRTAEQSE